QLGFNYRLPDINCAIGAVQMRRLDEILTKRQQVASWYLARLRDERRVSMQRVPSDVKMSWFVMVVKLGDDYSREQRDTILKKLHDQGIGCREYFTPIHLQPFYREMGCKQGQFPITEAVSSRTIALPFHNLLSEADVDRVVTALRKLL